MLATAFAGSLAITVLTHLPRGSAGRSLVVSHRPGTFSGQVWRAPPPAMRREPTATF